MTISLGKDQKYFNLFSPYHSSWFELPLAPFLRVAKAQTVSALNPSNTSSAQQEVQHMCTDIVTGKVDKVRENLPSKYELRLILSIHAHKLGY